MPNLCLFCPHCDETLGQFWRQAWLAPAPSPRRVLIRNILAAVGAAAIELHAIVFLHPWSGIYGKVAALVLAAFILLPILIFCTVRISGESSLRTPLQLLLLVLSAAGVTYLIVLAVFLVLFAACSAGCR
jgi:hypothetical protein